MSTTPSFDELPTIDALGLRHAWGVFGEDDQVGTLNRITPQRRLAALSSARTGETINITLPLDQPDPPLYRRPAYKHVIFASGRNSIDDYLDGFHPQGSTQWDGLRHIRCREYGFYGGYTGDFTATAGPLGIEHWAEHGIIGRGVMLDLVGYCRAVGRDYDPFSGEGIEPELLEATAEHQGVTIESGDILCLHFGWMEQYFSIPEAERGSSSGRDTFAGLAGSEAIARFLWDSGCAAVVCDNPAVEVSPGDASIGSMHRRVIPTLGLALGELFDFRNLAEHCVTAQQWQFCFVAVPSNVPGAVGSPGNAVAIV